MQQLYIGYLHWLTHYHLQLHILSHLPRRSPAHLLSSAEITCLSRYLQISLHLLRWSSPLVAHLVQFEGFLATRGSFFRFLSTLRIFVGPSCLRMEYAQRAWVFRSALLSSDLQWYFSIPSLGIGESGLEGCIERWLAICLLKAVQTTWKLVLVVFLPNQ